MQFKDESLSAHSPFDVRFSDEADLETWERGRNEEWEATSSISRKREERRRDRDPL